MRQVYICFSVPKYEGHALDPIRNLYHLLSTGQYTLSLINSCSLYLFLKINNGLWWEGSTPKK